MSSGSGGGAGGAITYAQQAQLRRLPVPEVADTVSKYLRTVRPLLHADDFATTSGLAMNFMERGGVAEEAQALLKQRAASHPNWLEKWWDVFYTADRSPVCVNANYYFWLADDADAMASSLPAGASRQTDRAARLLEGAMRFKVGLDRETMPPDADRSGPVDMNQFARLFAHARVPAEGEDVLVNYGQPPVSMPAELQHFLTRWPNAGKGDASRPRHVAVLAPGGRYFAVDVVDADGITPLPAPRIRAALDEVLAQAAAMGPASDAEGARLGAFTAWDRDSWAAARGRLLGSGDGAATNAATLDVVDSALLVLVLDDEAPADADAATHAYLHGSGTNRWFDKHQLIVAPDGQAAFNGEHAPGDGMTTLTLCNNMVAFSNSDAAREAEGSDAAAASAVRPLKWDLGASSLDDVAAAVDAAENFFSGVNSVAHFHRAFGAQAIKGLGVSPDAFAQLGMQLAFYRQFGYNVATYESNSTRGFLHGRTETVRSCSIESREMCRELAAPVAVMTEEKRRRMARAVRDAAASHVDYMRTSKEGHGVDRHLLGLKLIMGEHGLSLPADADIYSDGAYALSNTWRMSTSHCGSPALKMFGFGAVTGNGYGLGYIVQPDHIATSVSSFAAAEPAMDAALYARLLGEAFDLLNDVLARDK